MSGLLLAVAAEAAQAPDIAQETYGPWPNCLVLRGGDCKAVVVPAVGGRLLSYSSNGENILADNPDARWGTTLGTSNLWAGGYQLDLGPELRGLPEHLWLWQGPWGWRVPQPCTVHVFSDLQFSAGVQLEKEFVIDPDTGDLGLSQRIRNLETNAVSFCLWDRTLCKGGGYVLLPLNKRSRFKAGWSQRRGEKPADYRYDGDRPSDQRVRVLDGVLVAHARDLPEAGELKAGADSEAGWIAYTRGKILFVKYFPVFAQGNYSDGGNTVAFDCDRRGVELQPLSPETTLKGGGTYNFPEKWTFIELDKEVTTYDKARALVKRIPRSPFANRAPAP